MKRVFPAPMFPSKAMVNAFLVVFSLILTVMLMD
jgi:hypothetical protein